MFKIQCLDENRIENKKFESQFSFLEKKLMQGLMGVEKEK